MRKTEDDGKGYTRTLVQDEKLPGPTVKTIGVAKGVIVPDWVKPGTWLHPGVAMALGTQLIACASEAYGEPPPDVQELSDRLDSVLDDLRQQHRTTIGCTCPMSVRGHMGGMSAVQAGPHHSRGCVKFREAETVGPM